MLLTIPGCGGGIVATYDSIPHEVIVDSAKGSDTFRLKYVIKVIEGNKVSYVRNVKYIGIKTPETDEPFYKSAIELNKSLLSGKNLARGKRNRIKLEFDKEKLSPNDRLLAYVYVGDLFVNAEMIKRGYARASSVEPNIRYSELFRELEDEAREKKLGIWSLPESSSWQAVSNKAEHEYVASESSKVFHLPSCKWAEMIAKENRIYFSTFKEALDSGREPCKVCKPK